VKLRLDKYVWCVRLTKTRNEATTLIKNGKILLNQHHVKPSKEIAVLDVIQVKKHNAIFSFKTIELIDRRIGPKLVSTYIEETTPDSEKDKYKEYQQAQKEYNQYGIGKPTKKQRRTITLFKNVTETD
jgi:ribosome-associated heat shock protein Hsp15